MTIFKLGLTLGVATTLLAACGDSGTYTKTATESGDENSLVSIDFDKYTLENGLDVILHVDKSDPIVAIDLAAHVGSGRETTGRTGFAHLFEHLLFLDSENLGYGGLDLMNTRIGGEGTNGFTSNDMTQYFQAVPADALEKVIWAEADKLGYFIKTVTQPVVDNEKQVVKNEKRQSVDNRPYGHNFYMIAKALYPEDHPYNWSVIGSLADLDAATLEDVQNFYKRWYVPNNVTVTITGDFDVAEAKTLVEKYFGEIPRGEAVEEMAARPGVLTESKSLYHEDNFATVPQLTMVWPSVEEFNPDLYAIDILNEYLTIGKTAPLNEVLIDEEKLTSEIDMFSYTKELSGEIFLMMTSNSGDDLAGLVPAIERGLARFEENGISQEALDRIKAGLEVEFYEGIQSVLGKAIQLAQYNVYAGDPGYYKNDIENIQAVTTDDVMRVYKKYMKDKPFIATSIVPKGELELALEGSTKADVVEEPIVQGAEEEVDFDPTARTFEPTPSKFDRTVEPEFGKAYTLATPTVWQSEMANGINVYGIESDETPLISFSLAIDAGRGRGDAAKPAVPDLTADMLSKGTVNKTTAELEDAIKSLGSTISVSAGDTGTFVQASSLARNLGATVALVEEMLLQPRWDAEEFETLKRRQISQIDQDAGNPRAIAIREVAKLRYPEGHILRYPSYGPKDRLETVTLDDLKSFYASNYSPIGTRLRIVGNVDEAGVADAFAGLSENWDGVASEPISLALSEPIESSKIFFYDVPGSKQSVLRIERPAISALDPDLPLATAMNYFLGGIYTSELNTELRVNRGYTYGISSRFRSSKDRGSFTIGSSVRTNVTKESLEIIRDIVGNFGPDFTQEDLDVMKGALLRGQALETETLNAKLSMLAEISSYGYPSDYKAQNAKRIEAMTLEEFKALAGKYLTPDAMHYLVVGDAATQASLLSEIGYGEVEILNP
jgi:zinc protease